MSVLARYRKPGGFKQLLQLIETSGPAKQEKLLEVVEKEDPTWAELIRQKKITPEMFMGWDIEHQCMILEHMQVKHAAVLIKKMGDEKIKEFRQLLKLQKFNDIRDAMDSLGDLKPVEISAANNNMLETVRYCDEEKIIDLRYIDPALDLSEAA